MNLKENINTLLKAVGLRAETIAFAQMKSEDGVVIFEAESFEPDFSVGIVQEDGIVPVPIGEYLLEDGNTMVVAVEGIIAEIKAVELEEVVTENPTPAPSVDPTVKKVVESVTKETFFSENVLLKAEIEILKAQLETKAEVVELEAVVEPIVFNPENEKPVELHQFAKRGGRSKLDEIFELISK